MRPMIGETSVDGGLILKMHLASAIQDTAAVGDFVALSATDDLTAVATVNEKVPFGRIVALGLDKTTSPGSPYGGSLTASVYLLGRHIVNAITASSAIASGDGVEIDGTAAQVFQTTGAAAAYGAPVALTAAAKNGDVIYAAF